MSVACGGTNVKRSNEREKIRTILRTLYSTLLYYTLFYSILLYSILFYSILFSSIISSKKRYISVTQRYISVTQRYKIALQPTLQHRYNDFFWIFFLTLLRKLFLLQKNDFSHLCRLFLLVKSLLRFPFLLVDFMAGSL